MITQIYKRKNYHQLINIIFNCNNKKFSTYMSYNLAVVYPYKNDAGEKKKYR